jgi:hypothetical protein
VLDDPDLICGLDQIRQCLLRFDPLLLRVGFIALEIDPQRRPTPVPDNRKTTRDPPSNSTRMPWFFDTDPSTGS